MKFYHKVSSEWLANRKNFLTASAIQELLPLTPTGRKRNIDKATLAIYAGKLTEVMEQEIESRSWAARGHLFEPYAIDQYNKHAPFAWPTLHHWDNVLIHGNGVAFSPDAMSFELDSSIDKTMIHRTRVHDSASSVTIGEVKCYEAKGHYATASADPMELSERWQIATSMYVLHTIETGHLILFNPSAKHKLFVRQYTRADLKDEIAMIDDIVNDYFDAVAKLDKEFNALAISDIKITEQEIINELQSQQEQWKHKNPLAL